MKRCPECGNRFFYAYVKQGVLLGADGKIEHYVDNDETDPEGDYDCSDCGMIFKTWEDIPDAD